MMQTTSSDAPHVAMLPCNWSTLVVPRYGAPLSGFFGNPANKNSSPQKAYCTFDTTRYGAAFELPGIGVVAQSLEDPWEYSEAAEGSLCGWIRDALTAQREAVHARIQVLGRLVLRTADVTCGAWYWLVPHLPRWLSLSALGEVITRPHAGSLAFFRTRVDIYAMSQHAFVVPSTELDVLIFYKTEATSCDEAFTRISRFTGDASAFLSKAPCRSADLSSAAIGSLHPAEHMVEIALRLVSFGVGLVEELTHLSLGSSQIQWTSAPTRSTLTEPVESVCSFDRRAYDVNTCVRVQCHSTAACRALSPTVEVVVSTVPDVATVTLLVLSFSLFAMRRKIQESMCLQIVLAALLGCAVVALVVAYVALQFITTTRFGKVGAWALFAAGGVAAVLNGAFGSIWHVFVTQLLVNVYARVIVVASSGLSAVLCYKFFGVHFRPILNTAVWVSAGWLLLLALQRNPDVVVHGALSLAAMLWLAGRILAWRRLRTAATPGTPAVPDRLQPIDDERPRSRFNDVDLVELNDPLDDDMVLAQVHSTTMQCNRVESPRQHRTWGTWYDTVGDHYTQRELQKLAVHIRQHPEAYLDRVTAPNGLARFAGLSDAGSVIDDNDDSVSYR